MLLNINKINSVVKLKGWTLKGFSKKIGITESTYHNLKKTGDFRLSQLESMSKLLELPISELFEEEKKIKNYQVHPQSAKNGKFRLTTIPDVLVEFIEQLKLDKYNSDLYAFSNNLQPGKIVKNVRFTGKRWASMRKILGFKKEYQMYSLRDTGIINLIQSGVSLEVVAKQAGHADLTITSRYALHANKEANEQIKDKAKKF